MTKRSNNKLRQLINHNILQKMVENNPELNTSDVDSTGSDTVTVDNSEPVTTNVTEENINGDNTPAGSTEPVVTVGKETAAPVVMDPLSLVEQSSEKPAAVLTAESIIAEAANQPELHPHVAAVIAMSNNAEENQEAAAAPEITDENAASETAVETVETKEEVVTETNMSFNPWVVLLLVILLIIIVYGIYRFSRK